MLLLAIVIEVKVEIQHSRGRVEWLTIENMLEGGRAEQGYRTRGCHRARDMSVFRLSNQ